MKTVDMLSSGGRVSKALPDFELRPQQIEMAEAVSKAFEAGEHLIVEAGTGVGKSFAYLIPAIEHALRSGGRVVISTHTIALQEQLIHKDIPFLRSVFPEEFSAVLVKGRSNYLGLRRLTRASRGQHKLFARRDDLAELHRVEDWAYKTEDGSLADLDPQPAWAIWDKINSDADDCMGKRCVNFRTCFYQRARRQAAAAQILVVNHALLCADLALRRDGVSILPDYTHVVLDEAHTLERVASDHFGATVSSPQIYYLLNSLSHERTGRGVLRAHYGDDASAAVVEAVDEARHTALNYFAAIESWDGPGRNGNGRLRQRLDIAEDVSAALVELREQLRTLREQVKDDEQRSELAAWMDRCGTQATDIRRWHAQEQDDWVYWFDVREGFQARVNLAGRPIDVGPVLKESLFDAMKSVVLTSATLTTSGSDPFSYIRKRLGLADVRALQLGSPFDYRQQVSVHIEPDLPEPSSPAAFAPAACEAIKKYLLKTRGDAFVLFTGFAMMRDFAERLSAFLAEQHMMSLVQGSGMPRSALLDAFRSTPGSVLFGADTFWAGVDVPGPSLRSVIIVRLPFAVPNHPVTEARIERMKSLGQNPFLEFQVPEAILRFKQGVGRLIRRRDDEGIIVVLDPRVRTKSYGKHFLQALPDCDVQVGC